jgi:hypothetical protein
LVASCGVARTGDAIATVRIAAALEIATRPKRDDARALEPIRP